MSVIYKGTTGQADLSTDTYTLETGAITSWKVYLSDDESTIISSWNQSTGSDGETGWNIDWDGNITVPNNTLSRELTASYINDTITSGGHSALRTWDFTVSGLKDITVPGEGFPLIIDNLHQVIGSGTNAFDDNNETFCAINSEESIVYTFESPIAIKAVRCKMTLTTGSGYSGYVRVAGSLDGSFNDEVIIGGISFQLENEKTYNLSNNTEYKAYRFESREGPPTQIIVEELEFLIEHNPVVAIPPIPNITDIVSKNNGTVEALLHIPSPYDSSWNEVGLLLANEHFPYNIDLTSGTYPLHTSSFPTYFVPNRKTGFAWSSTGGSSDACMIAASPLLAINDGIIQNPQSLPDNTVSLILQRLVSENVWEDLQLISASDTIINQDDIEDGDILRWKLNFTTLGTGDTFSVSEGVEFQEIEEDSSSSDEPDEESSENSSETEEESSSETNEEDNDNIIYKGDGCNCSEPEYSLEVVLSSVSNDNIDYFEGGEDLPPGRYCIEYVEGGVKYAQNGNWSINAVQPNPNGIGIRISNGNNFDIQAPGLFNAFTTLNECEEANFGQCVYFQHSGGQIGIYLNDTNYSDNIIGQRAPKYSLCGPLLLGGAKGDDTLHVSAGIIKNSQGKYIVQTSASIVNENLNKTQDYSFFWLIQNQIIEDEPQAIIIVDEVDVVISVIAYNKEGIGTLTHTLVLNGPFAQNYDEEKVSQSLDYNIFLQGNIIPQDDLVANNFLIQASTNVTGHTSDTTYKWWINGVEKDEDSLEADVISNIPYAIITVKGTKIVDGESVKIAVDTFLLTIDSEVYPIEENTTKGSKDNIWSVGNNNSSVFDIHLDGGIIRIDEDTCAIQASVNILGLTEEDDSPYKSEDLDIKWWIQGTEREGKEFVTTLFDNNRQGIITVVVEHEETGSIVSKTIILKEVGEYINSPESIENIPVYHNDLECGLIKLINGKFLLQATSTTLLNNNLSGSEINKEWALNGILQPIFFGQSVPLFSNNLIERPEAILTICSELLTTNQKSTKTVVIKIEDEEESSSESSETCQPEKPPKPKIQKLGTATILVSGVTEDEWPDCTSYLTLETKSENELIWKELETNITKNHNQIFELPSCNKYSYRYVAYK